MWRLAICINYLLLIVAVFTYECKLSTFSDVSIRVKSVDNVTERINLNKCPMSTIILSENTKEIRSVDQNISELPALSVSYLHYLTQVDFKSNGIKFVRPNAFYEVSSLTNIYLENNDIEEIWNGVFSTVKSLKTLNLNANLIRRIDDSAFADMLNLSRVDLAGNNLTEWNKYWFSTSPNLRNVNMQRNKLKFLPLRAFFHNKHITSVDFSHNLLTSVHSETFSGLTKMHSLRLDNNLLKFFHPDTFAPFNGSVQTYTKEERRELNERGIYPSYDRLGTLYIDNNRLTYLPRKMLNDLNEIRTINVHSNPFECSCYLEILHWLAENTNKHKREISVDVFKVSCLRRSNPVCAATLKHPATCVEEVDEEVVDFYFKNFVPAEYSPSIDVDNPSDLVCH